MSELVGTIGCEPHVHRSAVPRIVHQTYPTLDMPADLRKNIDRLKQHNPDWEHRFYTDRDVERFIASSYGEQMLSYYARINPEYGAARADLFRYLLMYRIGGVYLDAKSTSLVPLDQLLDAGDTFILSKWDNGAGGRHPNFGMYPELDHVAGGEFQQWHIITVPGHPFLKAVIETVLRNIDEYRPWLHGTGGKGVLKLTGPIAYTLAITPLLDRHDHRRVRYERDIGVQYSFYPSAVQHRALFRTHYSGNSSSIVLMEGLRRYQAALHRFRAKVRRLPGKARRIVKKAVAPAFRHHGE